MSGSDPRKLSHAELFWKQTTVSQEWAAAKLLMRNVANVSQQLPAQIPPGLKQALDKARSRGRQELPTAPFLRH